METGRRTRKKIIIRNGAKTINPTTVVGDLIIIIIIIIIILIIIITRYEL